MKITRKAIALLLGISLTAALTGCSGTSPKLEELKKTRIDNFNSIQVEAAVAEVEIVPEAEEYAIEYHIYNQTVDYSIKDGAFKLKAGGSKKNSTYKNGSSYIRIYVPEGSEFSDIDCKTSVGDIHIVRITADDMTARAAVGDVILAEITVNNELNAGAEVGNIEVNLANDDCSYDLSAEIGNLMIDGAKYSGIGVKKSHTAAQGPKVKLETQTGNISFDCESTP